MSGCKPGAYLGAVVDLATLRDRCVINSDSGCWHLRAANGQPLVGHAANPPKIFVHKMGRVSARRIAKMFKLGADLSPDVVVATCKLVQDCVNPEHLPILSRHALGRRLKTLGRTRSMRKTAGITKARRARAERFTDELATWARESEQSQRAIAHGIGCSQQMVSEVCSGKAWNGIITAGSSVFQWRPAA